MDSLREWLLHTRQVDPAHFVEELVRQLLRQGVAVARLATHVRTLHPEVLEANLVWTVEDGMRVTYHPHQILVSKAFLESPLAPLRPGELFYRDLSRDRDFPICEELWAQGYASYAALALHGSGPRRYLTVAGREPLGARSLAVLLDAVPLIALRLELLSAQYATRSLLEVYLGKSAARRVLAGGFRRGTGEEIEAAIVCADLRGFTGLTHDLDPGQVVDTLDGYFDSVAGAVLDHGGEVLELIGDGMIAIFPVGGDPGAACSSATEAARQARSAAVAAGFDVGVAVHLGVVMYGNIGARERFDFTVIGRAVNEVVRAEALCRKLGHGLLLTGIVASHLDLPLLSLGPHVLRGVRKPVELYTLRE